MYAIKGFRVPKVSLNKAETILNEIKKRVNVLANKRYNELLSREIESTVDNIVLGNIPQPKEQSIFDASVESLNKKIASATARRDNTEYNLSCSANLLLYENDTYVEICALNEMYDKVYEDIEGIEDFSVVDDGSLIPAADPKYEVWKDIIAKYKHETVFTMRLYPVSGMKKPEFSDLHFNSVEVRSEVSARHFIANVLLGGYSCGEQIQPYQLMELMDYALMRSSDAALSSSLKSRKNELMRILPEITEEMITKVK